MEKSRRTLDKQCTITVKVKKFCHESIHVPGGRPSNNFIDYDVSCCYFDYHYPVTVYPNGHNSETEGFISVVFTAETFLKGWKYWHGNLVELRGLIAVVGAEDSRRFPRSFAVLGDLTKPDFDPTFVIDRYVSRRALLGERDELLGTEDTLTLHMVISLVETHLRHPYGADIIQLSEFVSLDLETSLQNGPVISQDLTDDPIPMTSRDHEEDMPSYYLMIDSAAVEQRLSRKSPDEYFLYFRCMSVTPLAARNLAYKKPLEKEEDYERVTSLARILLNRPHFTVHSAVHLIDLYIEGADIYDVPILVNACRRWLNLCMDASNVSLISAFADARNDDWLKRSVESFREKIQKPGLPFREYPRHVTVGSLLFGGAAAIEVNSLDEIMDLYSTVTKYRSSTSSLKDTCLRWLRLCFTLKSFVCGSFTWKDYKRVHRLGDESLKDVLRALMTSCCGRKVIGSWRRIGITREDVADIALFVHAYEDSPLSESFEAFLGRRGSERSDETAWHDFRSLVGTLDEEKWTCEYVVPGRGGSSYRLLFRYHQLHVEDNSRERSVNNSSFNFYS